MTSGNSSLKPSLGKRITRSAALHAAQQWTTRLAGLFNLAITARLLLPADFGIMAFIASISEFGTLILGTLASTAIIRAPKLSPALMATAWWIRLSLAFLFALLLFLLAPYAADYAGNPAITAPMQVLAVLLIIDGFTSVGIFAAQRDLNFKPSVTTTLAREMTRVITSIMLAYALQTVWALVFAQIAGSLIGAFVSHRMSQQPFTGPTKTAATQLFSVFSWGLIEHVSDVLFQRLDRLFLASTISTSLLGIYSVAVELALLPVKMLVAPMMSSLLPGIKLAKEEEKEEAGPAYKETSRKISKALAVGFSVILPAALGLGLVATYLVPVFLGSQWRSSGHILTYACLLCLSTGIFYLLRVMLAGLGALREAALLSSLQAVLFLPFLMVPALQVALPAEPQSVLPVTPDNLLTGLGLITLQRATAGGLAAVAAYLTLRKLSGALLPVADMGRTTVSAAVMALAVLMITPIGHSLPPLLQLGLLIAGGGLVYTFMRLLLWQLAGRPDTLERRLLHLISAKKPTSETVLTSKERKPDAS